MKTVAILMSAIVAFSSIQACVTYTPSTGTYTVNKGGSVPFSKTQAHKTDNKK